MSYSKNNHTFAKSNLAPECSAISNIAKCVDCHGDLLFIDNKFMCSSCKRDYECVDGSVWDFRQRNKSLSLPAIFGEEEFIRWNKIFREQESKNWVIYKNSFFRFIAQAGHRILGNRINEDANEKSLILEVGAGTGALLEHVPSANFIAVDTSIESLQVLKSRWPNATCICASAYSLPFKNSSFHQVVSLHTLEHLYFLAEALQELIRVMEDDGTMHYVIPTEGGLGFLLGRKLVTGPHLRKKYNLDVHYVMDREHINDAPRVLKLLRMYFAKAECKYWPLPFLRLLSPNAMIYGRCTKPIQNGDSSD